MRKLILALMTLACLTAGAAAQQQQTSTADQGKPGAAPWPVSWTGQSVLADLRVGGAAVASGNPVPVTVGNAFALDATLAGLSAKTPALGTQTKAASRSTTPASDLANLEPAATPITGATMPAGGTGLTGWLSGIWSLLNSAQTRVVMFADQSQQAYAVSAAVTGAMRDASSYPRMTKYNISIASDQNGTLFFQGSNDAFVTSVSTSIQPVTANIPVTYSVPLTYRYNRFVYGNGPGGAATVSIASSFSEN